MEKSIYSHIIIATILKSASFSCDHVDYHFQEKQKKEWGKFRVVIHEDISEEQINFLNDWFQFGFRDVGIYKAGGLVPENFLRWIASLKTTMLVFQSVHLDEFNGNIISTTSCKNVKFMQCKGRFDGFTEEFIQQLEELRLFDCRIDTNGFDILFKRLESSNINILVLDRVSLLVYFEQIKQLIPKLRKLKTINLAFNGFSGQHVSGLIQAANQCNYLESLSFEQIGRNARLSLDESKEVLKIYKTHPRLNSVFVKMVNINVDQFVEIDKLQKEFNLVKNIRYFGRYRYEKFMLLMSIALFPYHAKHSFLKLLSSDLIRLIWKCFF